MESCFKDIKHHTSHYFALLVILNLGIGMFYLLRFSKIYQILILVLTGMVYVAWGVVHHWLEEDLHLKVAMEYLLIALLANLLIISLLLRG